MFHTTVGLVCAALHLAQAVNTVDSQKRVFEIDYEHDTFLKDGQPFRYISGSLHYFRVPRAYWQDRLRKYRAAGLNAISTYVQWSLHEPSPGVYDFSGENDVEHFIKLAQQEGLLVILRPGPYICAERDFGGYPPWLLNKNPAMCLRTSDQDHTRYVLSWLTELFPKIQPLLYGNGGPIIMVQVENEYGSYWACDTNYTRWLRDVFRDYVGDKAVLFTTDGAASEYLRCGPIPGVFATVDFGAGNATEAFEPLRKIQKHGPLVNSEFYPGWLTHWGDSREAKVSTEQIVNTTKQLLLLNASFNFYMFHGGTNFGLSSGANIPPFLPQLTSYDYDAPISESGNLTEKYYAIKSVIAQFQPTEDIPVRTATPAAYGTVTLSPKVSLFDSDTEVDYGEFVYPQTCESLQLYGGFMLYQTTLPPGYTGRGYLLAKNTHDRTIVYVNKKPAGVLSRSYDFYSLIVGGREGQPLSLLVENQGHINYGHMLDLKGLVDNVTLQGDVLTGWRHTGYPMSDVSHIPDLATVQEVTLPAYYAGTLMVPGSEDGPQDTFVDMTGWGKGLVYINNFNLGRYWPSVGPQVTLYLPGSLLRVGQNTVVVLELEAVHPNRTVSFVAEPIWTNLSTQELQAVSNVMEGVSVQLL